MPTSRRHIATIRTGLGDAILRVAGFHALAGLYHHFVATEGADIDASTLAFVRQPEGRLN